MSKKNEKVEKVKQATITLSIPLKHINYQSKVSGTFARVKCIQYFKNDAQDPVEAVYVFPMPDEATITACIMQIGKRKVEAELKKRKEARKEYEEAIKKGHYASLLEQERPNIFTMNVGGIEPGEKISVEIDYVQRVPWQTGGGRFTIPLVVAPRFIPGTPVGRQADGWSPDTDQVPDASCITPVVAKQGVSYDADISVMFSPGFRCMLSSPSHSSIIKEQKVTKTATIKLKTGDVRTDRDFILVYKSLATIPEVTAHTGKFNGESFMLTSIIPPGDIAPVSADIVLVLDCSGSMRGPKIDGLKIIAKKIVRNLGNQNVNHRVGIVPFDNHPWPSHPLSEINENTENFIEGLEARGGTMLGPALTTAHQQFKDPGQRKEVILLVTDGQTESLDYVGKGVRIITVGIDSAVNDDVIKNLANKTGGVYEFVYPGEDYSTVANRTVGYISGPVLNNVEVRAKGDVVGVSDVFKGRPATIAVRFKDKAGEVEISGRDPDNKKISWVISPSDANECDFAAQVWARDYIRENQDEQQQTEVSLKYRVICRHTSFVAVSLKEIPGKKPKRVEIPVNLPVGWDYEAVFGGDIRIARLSTKLCLSLDAAVPLIRSPKTSDLSLPVPLIRSPKDITLNRFTLDAKDIIDRLVAILIEIGKDRDAAEKVFAEMKKKLTAKKVAKLTEEKRAMAYYFACRLAQYGLKLNSDVMTELRTTPKAKKSLALAWYNLALKEEGCPFTFYKIIPSNNQYIAWKFGEGEKPRSGEWSFVP